MIWVGIAIGLVVGFILGVVARSIGAAVPWHGNPGPFGGARR